MEKRKVRPVIDFYRRQLGEVKPGWGWWQRLFSRVNSGSYFSDVRCDEALGRGNVEEVAAIRDSRAFERG